MLIHIAAYGKYHGVMKPELDIVELRSVSGHSFVVMRKEVRPLINGLAKILGFKITNTEAVEAESFVDVNGGIP
jgi:hypothetical protein